MADDNPPRSKTLKNKRAPYANPRTLIHWTPTKDQFLLLALVHECDKAGIDLPLGEAIKHLSDQSSGEAARQHFTKLRKQRIDKDEPVPPRLDRNRRELPDDDQDKGLATTGDATYVSIVANLNSRAKQIEQKSKVVSNVKRSNNVANPPLNPAKKRKVDAVATPALKKQDRPKRVKIEDEEEEDEVIEMTRKNGDDDYAPSSEVGVKSGPSATKTFGKQSLSRSSRAGINYAEPAIDSDEAEDRDRHDAGDEGIVEETQQAGQFLQATDAVIGVAQVPGTRAIKLPISGEKLVGVSTTTPVPRRIQSLPTPASTSQQIQKMDYITMQQMAMAPPRAWTDPYAMRQPSPSKIVSSSAPSMPAFGQGQISTPFTPQLWNGVNWMQNGHQTPSAQPRYNSALFASNMSVSPEHKIVGKFQGAATPALNDNAVAGGRFGQPSYGAQGFNMGSSQALSNGSTLATNVGSIPSFNMSNTQAFNNTQSFDGTQAYDTPHTSFLQTNATNPSQQSQYRSQELDDFVANSMVTMQNPYSTAGTAMNPPAFTAAQNTATAQDVKNKPVNVQLYPDSYAQATPNNFNTNFNTNSMNNFQYDNSASDTTMSGQTMTPQAMNNNSHSTSNNFSTLADFSGQVMQAAQADQPRNDDGQANTGAENFGYDDMSYLVDFEGGYMGQDTKPQW